MASKTTLNTKNLAALGPERLAALLIDLSTGDEAMKRRLRLELAGAAGPADAAREIRAIHARGLKAWVFTVNEPAHAARLIDASIDGIFTDELASLKKLAAN